MHQYVLTIPTPALVTAITRWRQASDWYHTTPLHQAWPNATASLSRAIRAGEAELARRENR